jgi:ankyrin repeat protein
MAATESRPNPFEGKPDYSKPVGPPMKEEHFIRGSTPLHKAAALLKFDEVDKLLAEGCKDVNTGDNLDQTPLILLSRNHYDTDDVPKAVAMIEKLIGVGARIVDPETGKCLRDQYGDSMLHLAAMATGRNGHTVLKCLVDHLPTDGPYTKSQLVSARCKNFGNTALHWATLNTNVEACEMLIEAGARLERKNRLKETVLDYAVKYESPKLKVKYEGLMPSS